MEKSWMMMMDQTDKKHELTKNSRKLVPQVRCSMPETAVCDLETGVIWQVAGEE